MLARRALSAAEVKQRLTRKGFGAAEVAAELTRLRRLGLLEDAQLARMVVRDQTRRGFGRRSAGAALRGRRVGAEESESAIAELGTEESAAALAVAMGKALRRYAGFRRLPAIRRKMVRYLLARGFAMAEVLDAVERAAGEPDDAEDQEETDHAGDPPDLP